MKYKLNLFPKETRNLDYNYYNYMWYPRIIIWTQLEGLPWPVEKKIEVVIGMTGDWTRA